MVSYRIDQKIKKSVRIKCRDQDSNLGLLPEADALPLSYRGFTFRLLYFLSILMKKVLGLLGPNFEFKI